MLLVLSPVSNPEWEYFPFSIVMQSNFTHVGLVGKNDAQVLIARTSPSYLAGSFLRFRTFSCWQNYQNPDKQPCIFCKHPSTSTKYSPSLAFIQFPHSKYLVDILFHSSWEKSGRTQHDCIWCESNASKYGGNEKQTRKSNSHQNYCLVWTRGKETSFSGASELALEELGLPMMRKLWVAKPLSLPPLLLSLAAGNTFVSVRKPRLGTFLGTKDSQLS